MNRIQIKATSKSATNKLLHYGILLALLLFTILASMLNISIWEKLVLIFAIWTFGLRLGSIYALGLGLFLLMITPLFSELGQKEWSQQTSVFTFYLLAIGTVAMLFERDPEPARQNLASNDQRLGSKELGSELSMQATARYSKKKIRSETPEIAESPKIVGSDENFRGSRRPLSNQAKKRTKRMLIQG